MIKKITIITFFIITLFSCITIKKVELDAIKDAYICDCKPDETNPNGDKYVLYQGQFHTCFDRTLIKWDLSNLKKNASIKKAEVWFYVNELHGRISGQMAFYPLLQEWDENKVTINNMPPFKKDIKIVANWPIERGCHHIDITDIVEKWQKKEIENHGLFCHSELTTSACVAEYFSSDSLEAKYRPKLKIEYEK